MSEVLLYTGIALETVAFGTYFGRRIQLKIGGEK